jgi:hypothetical protein
MTLFINLRASANGGIVAAEASAWDDGALYVSPKDFANRIEGRDAYRSESERTRLQRRKSVA